MVRPTKTNVAPYCNKTSNTLEGTMVFKTVKTG